jgi:hypothetical protein
VRQHQPFQPDDLEDLDALLARAHAVVPMREIAAGLPSAGVIGLRHDVDNTISEAVAFAQWEAERGYRATYYILHTAPYWLMKDTLAEALEVIADCGHEIGFHVNAIAEALRTNGDPVKILADEVDELRSFGYPVTGVVAHGDPLCHSVGFVNDEMFTESARPSYGAPDRLLGHLQLQPVSRTHFGFEYDPNWLPRGNYISDSGGEWSQPFDEVAAAWPTQGQLHMLIHACWWGEAFATEAVR